MLLQLSDPRVTAANEKARTDSEWRFADWIVARRETDKSFSSAPYSFPIIDGALMTGRSNRKQSDRDNCDACKGFP
jgi:hypothetical protein